MRRVSQRLLQQCWRPDAGRSIDRGLSATAPAAAGVLLPHHDLPSEPVGLVELRQYTLKPEGIKSFLQLTGEYVQLRREKTPFLGMFTCDTGALLNQVTHFYHYRDYDHRDNVRQAMLQDSAWQEAYINKSRPFVAQQESRILRHAEGVHRTVGAPSVSAFESPTRPPPGQAPALYEMRSYQLHHGDYNMQKAVDGLRQGLSAKIRAGPDGQLVFFGYSGVGLLNSIVELWRYPSAQSCIRAREEAMRTPEWVQTISQVTPFVQSFTTSFLQPTAFSPWQ